jgi:DNA-binding HxlR family transcriptional regulator
MPTQKRRSDCPINYALELFGDRWTLLIVRDLLFKGKHYYGEFLQAEEKIATNTLAHRLALLETSGIVTKTGDPGHGSKFIYRISEKGIHLVPMLVEAILWSAKYDPDTTAEAEFLQLAAADKSGLINRIMEDLKAEMGDGERVD